LTGSPFSLIVSSPEKKENAFNHRAHREYLAFSPFSDFGLRNADLGLVNKLEQWSTGVLRISDTLLLSFSFSSPARLNVFAYLTQGALRGLI
jgi:hypothetical protein